MGLLIGAACTHPQAKVRGPDQSQRVMKGECSMSRSLRSDVRIRDSMLRRGGAGTDMTPPAAVRYVWSRTSRKVRNQTYLVEG